MKERLPFATESLPGTGGVIRRDPADFVVEELPLYEPCGDGEHVYVRVEKRGLATLTVVERLARALRIPSHRIGYAGMKDARAITRQTLSIHGVDESAVEQVELEGVRLLWVKRHRNKLKRGHLRGNRFELRIRDCDPARLPAAAAVLEQLRATGVPNYFGPQRFGRYGNTDRLGLAVLRHDPDLLLEELLHGHPSARDLVAAGDLAGAAASLPGGASVERRVVEGAARAGAAEGALRAVPRRLRQLYVSGLQSRLFNDLAAQRIDRLGQLERGDLAWIHDRGAVFLVEDEEECRPRALRLEISPSGPLFGSRCLRAQHAPGQLEDEVLARNGLSDADFASVRDLRGARRPFRVPLGEVQLEPADDGFRVGFDLPPGSYATVVLREVLKVDCDLPGEGAGDADQESG